MAAAAAAPEAPRREPIVIGVYNYKGGAGKTTTMINLAAVAAHTQGKRVLVVDADPQCNMSSFFYPPPKEDDEEEKEDASSVDSPAVANPIHVPLDDTGDLPVIDMYPLSPVKATELDLARLKSGFEHSNPNLFNLLNYTILKGAPKLDDAVLDSIPTRSVHPDITDEASTLFVVAGSPKIPNFDSAFVSDEFKFAMVVNSLRRLIDRITARHNIDLVLVDFGPSSSTLNKYVYP